MCFSESVFIMINIIIIKYKRRNSKFLLHLFFIKLYYECKTSILKASLQYKKIQSIFYKIFLIAEAGRGSPRPGAWKGSLKSLPGPGTGSSSRPESGSMSPPARTPRVQPSSFCWPPSVRSPASSAKSNGRPLRRLRRRAVCTWASQTWGERWPFGR